MLAGVQHPHVVRLRGVHGVDDALVLVLDLAPGGSLARLLATRGTLSPGEVVTLGVPLAQALAAVHAQGLVHGDVTPANVLFAADGRPLLGRPGRRRAHRPATRGGRRHQRLHRPGRAVRCRARAGLGRPWPRRHLPRRAHRPAAL